MIPIAHRASSAGAAWRAALARALVSGTIASALSAAALAACGRVANGAAAGPLNGPSQWVWGERAAYRRRATLRHTLVGYVIHHLMSIFWATLHERLAPRHRSHSPAERVLTAAATAAVAWFVDYHLTPRRLRPGFEKQLGGKSLFVVYTAFALGLAAAARGGDRGGEFHGPRPFQDHGRAGCSGGGRGKAAVSLPAVAARLRHAGFRTMSSCARERPVTAPGASRPGPAIPVPGQGVVAGARPSAAALPPACASSAPLRDASFPACSWVVWP